MEEREVTLALRCFLLDRDWVILSVHFPGAQGGLSVSAYGKAKRWVPDLIALKKNVLLAVESKSHLVKADIDKLNMVFNDQKVMHGLKHKLNIAEETICQRAIAFHSTSYKIRNDIPDFLVFLARNKDDISVISGQRVSSAVKSLF